MVSYFWAGPVCLNQKAQVHDDMQTITRTLSIEHMLESADHLIEHHRGNSAMLGQPVNTPQLPNGWIVYSAQYALEGKKKGWNVEVMDTNRPFRKGSIVDAFDRKSLDAALRAANSKIASRPVSRA